KRGWYLTGKEPASLTEELAHYAKAQDWKAIDDALLAAAGEMDLDQDKFLQWLSEKGVRSCCINRMKVFLEARHADNHEVATLVGIPLIDELCRSLHNGR